MSDCIDSAALQVLDHRVVYVPICAAAALVVATVGLMCLRQHPHFGYWRFGSSEFEAIGIWFSGAAAAVAIGTGGYLVLNDRRRQEMRERLNDARQVQYVYKQDPDPSWVVHNGSARSIRLTSAGGRAFPSRTILPGGDIMLGPATMFARTGYRGDQPDDRQPIRFFDGEYDWSRIEDSLRGVRLPSSSVPSEESK